MEIQENLNFGDKNNDSKTNIKSDVNKRQSNNNIDELDKNNEIEIKDNDKAAEKSNESSIKNKKELDLNSEFKNIVGDPNGSQGNKKIYL